MIEKYFNTPEKVVLLERWMNSPDHAKPDVPPYLADKLERLQRAYRWMLLKHNKLVVAEMMYAYYTGIGKKYSESTARKDVNDAERLFITISKFTVPFTVELMVTSLQDRYYAAIAAGLNDAAAKFSAQLHKWIITLERIAKEREDGKHEAIPIRVTSDISAMGLKRDPNILQRAREWELQRAERLKMDVRKKPIEPNIADAEFTEEPDAG